MFFLGNHDYLLWNRQSSFDGNYYLHRLVISSFCEISISINLIKFFIHRGSCVDFLNKRGFTPLDIAIQQNNTKIISLLIWFETKKFQLFTTIDYLNTYTDTNIENLSKYLYSNSMIFRWYQSKEILKERLSEEEKNNEKSWILEGYEIGTLNLSNKFKNEIFDSNNLLIYHENDKNSSAFLKYHKLSCIIFKKILHLNNVHKNIENDSYFYLQQYPSFPGIEFAISSFFDEFIGFGYSYRTLTKITTNDNVSFPISFILGIEGNGLNTFLCSDEKLQNLLKTLDRNNFYELFLTCLLINFKNAKAENFKVEKHDQAHRIIGICNNEDAFTPSLLYNPQEKSFFISKSILYCMNIINHPITTRVREKFLGINIGQVLRSWLDQLINYNHQCQLLFTENELWKFQMGNKNINPCLILISFYKSTFTEIYNKFQRLQKILKSSKDCTCLDVLCSLTPELGYLYEEAFYSSDSPLERFNYLNELINKYNNNIIINQNLTSKSCNLISSIRISPEDCLDELNRLERQLNTSIHSRIKIREKLIQGDTILFENLLIDSEKEKIINGIDNDHQNLFPPLQFNEIHENYSYKIIKLIMKGNYQILKINQCANLNKKLFQNLYQSSPQLMELELINCKISQDILSTLIYFNSLKSLKLQSLQIEETQISICHLTLINLSIISLNNIKTIYFPDTIKSLHVENCINLEHLKPQTSMYKSKNTIQSFLNNSNKFKTILNSNELKNFLVSKFYCYNCPNLDPWGKIFYSNDFGGSIRDCEVIKLVDVPLQFENNNVYDVLISSICHTNINQAFKLFRKIVHFLNISPWKFYLIFSKLQIQGSSLRLLHPLTVTAQIYNDFFATLKDFSIHDVLNEVIDHYFISSLVESCPNLNFIDISNSTKISDQELIKISCHCRYLQTFILDSCPLISNTGVIYIVKNCLQLKILSLNNTKVSNKSIKLVSKVSIHIHSIHLLHCSLVNDIGVGSIARHVNSNLLEFSLPQNITDKSIDRISRYCKNLVFIDISCCKQLTDNSIHKLVKSCTLLETIVLSDFCVSSDCVNFLKNTYPNITLKFVSI